MITYEENSGSLLFVHEGKRYMISQTSGELVGAEGHRISDLYWSDISGGSAELVRELFRSIASDFTKIENVKNRYSSAASRIAALEAALAEAREVVKGVVNNLPESEIEIARPCLGNTNTSIAKQAVARAAEWLKKQEASA